LAQGACMAVEDAVCLTDQADAAESGYHAAFRAYQQARHLRTGAVQIIARVYGEGQPPRRGPRRMNNLMLGSRPPDEPMARKDRLYGEQKELTQGGAGAAQASKSHRE